MANKFVLDENIIVSIMTLHNEKGIRDHSSAILFLSIDQNGHIILLTNNIHIRYLRKFEEVKDSGKSIIGRFPHLYSLMMVDDTKTQWEADIPIPFQKGSFDPDDEVFVSLVARLHSILATQDGKLIRDLNRTNIPSTHKFIVDRPENLIDHAN